jgi:hypothetical protein
VTKTAKLLKGMGYRIVEGKGFEYVSKDYDGRNFGLSFPNEEVKRVGPLKLATLLHEKFKRFVPGSKEADGIGETPTVEAKEEKG